MHEVQLRLTCPRLQESLLQWPKIYKDNDGSSSGISDSGTRMCGSLSRYCEKAKSESGVLGGNGGYFWALCYPVCFYR